MRIFIVYELFPTVFNMSVTAGIVILFVLLARMALKKAPKIFSYVLWSVVLFRLLCPVSFTTDFSLLSLFDAPVRETTAATSSVEYIQPDIIHTEYPEIQLPIPIINETINRELPQGEEQLRADPLEAPVAIATWIWLFGIFLMLLYSVVSFILLRRRLTGAVPLQKNVYLADHIETPFVLGILRPNIYLPSSLTEKEQEYILLHEQHHIRRLDHMIKILAFVALSIHWFNPLVWLAFVLSGKDMEMSCDEAVIRKLGEDIRADYSASLLSLATGRRIIAGMPLAFGEGDTKSRIQNLLNWKKPKIWGILAAMIVCVAVIIACGANPENAENEPVENTTSDTTSEKDGEVSIIWNMEMPIPEAAAVHVEQFVKEQIAADQPVQEIRITEFEQINTGTAGNDFSINLYQLSTDGDTLKQHYILLLCDQRSGEEIWTFISDASYEDIQTYYTSNEEMQEWYDNEYTAYAMETYLSYMAAHPTVIYENTDLDRDGRTETIQVRELAPNQVYTLEIVKPDGTLLWSLDAGIPHMGWNSIYLYTDPAEGKQYLLKYNPSISTGAASYSYKLFSLENGGETIIKENKLTFMLEEAPDIEDELIAFADEINDLLRQSILLLSTQDFQLVVGPVSTEDYLEDLAELAEFLN